MKAERAKLLESSTVVTNKLREELTENTRYYTGRLNEAGATIGSFKDKLAAAQAKNQRLHNDLNSLQAQVAELRSQLETERASREEIEAELSPAKTKFCFGRHSSQKIKTRRGHNSQPARPPGAKNQKPTWQTWKPS